MLKYGSWVTSGTDGGRRVSAVARVHPRNNKRTEKGEIM
jgi:hypothetical protein